MKTKSFLLTITAAVLLSMSVAYVGTQTVAAPDQQDTTAAVSPAPPTSDTTSSDQSAGVGPVRLARFSLVSGDVSWRPSSGDQWSTAGVNVPLREGAQLWVANGGRAEVQFDDGSYIRLGDGAIVTLQTLYSDNDGEFTEIQLTQGLISLDLTNPSSIYQVDTPLTSVKAAGAAKVRVGVNDGVEIAVRNGKAAITGPGGDANLITGNYIYLADDSSPITIEPVPGQDSWDRWNDRREDTLSDDETASHVPDDVAVVAGDLGTYGIWREDPDYGWVWVPAASSPDWRPYEYGSWTYVEPFGWTWVSSEPWGWAPYHYGTWFHAGYGWAWVPGPARQYWSPAVVSFSDYNGNIGWCPLAPREVNYTSLTFAFGNGGSFFGFSIGEAGCYYPGAAGYCVGRPFNNAYVNRYGRPGYTSGAGRINRNPYIATGQFVPVNARVGGVMTATHESFGGSGHYVPGAANSSSYFQHGQVVGAPASAGHAFSGPVDAHAVASSWTPTRTFKSDSLPDNSVLNRAVVHAPQPSRFTQRTTSPVSSTQVTKPQADIPSSDGMRHMPSAPIGSSAANRAAQARQNLGVSPTSDRPQGPNPGQSRQDGGNSANRAVNIPRNSEQSIAPAAHVHDWSSQGTFHIDERNSGGGYSRSGSQSGPASNSSRGSNNAGASGNSATHTKGGGGFNGSNGGGRGDNGNSNDGRQNH
jgi:hypothetical protein